MREPWLSRTDQAFDRLIPEELRYLSSLHWTPVGVAIRATALLCPVRSMRILDVGAGVGKLCAVGALSSQARWCGIEQHETLVLSARRLARALGVGERTTFVHGDVFSIDWSDFDAIYLYNPFELPLFEAGDPAEHLARKRAQVSRVEQRLAAARRGTRVVTFHGFGGAMPASYELLYHEQVGTALDLALWVQRAAGASS